MAQIYDPKVGRYRQSDPIGLTGGDYNLYRYVGNDPVNYFDLWGLHSLREFGHDAAHFFIGLGDVSSFGITSWIRGTELYGGDSYTDNVRELIKLVNGLD